MKIIVTGGAGLIGHNALAHGLSKGHAPVVIDDLSRRGADANRGIPFLDDWADENPFGS